MNTELTKRPVDAEAIRRMYPDRKSLNGVLDKAETLRVTDTIEYVREEMCTFYCKMPSKYSAAEWSEMLENFDDYPEHPCNNCPLNLL